MLMRFSLVCRSRWGFCPRAGLAGIPWRDRPGGGDGFPL